MNRLPMWFWIIGILALIWNLVGVYQYISMRLITPEQFAQMDEALQQLHNATPAWVVAAFATAVFRVLWRVCFCFLKRVWLSCSF